MRKTLVLGLGNPILSDDGVGFVVIEELQEKVKNPQVTFSTSSLAGLNLLDIVSGFEKLVVVDAIVGREAGEVYQFRRDFPFTYNTTSSHGMDFFSALEVGRRMGYEIPHEIVVFAIGVSDVTTFSEHLTKEVEGAVPRACEMIESEIS